MITAEFAALVFRHPVLLFVLSFVSLYLVTWIAAVRMRSLRARIAEHRDDFSVVRGASLTLLGLLIAFAFSMALGRYDQRKNYEEEEANAIGTEFLRADLLPASEASVVRQLLREYVAQRIIFYTADQQGADASDSKVSELQARMWAAVRGPAMTQPLSPVIALAVSGMNDVINTQGYVQAAWLNRIPIGAWVLMGVIALCSSTLVGLSIRSERPDPLILPVLPLIVAIAFFLIADIDSPRQGVINVTPINLIALANSLRAP